MKSIQASSLHSEPSFSSTTTAGRPTSAGKIQALQGLRTVAFFAIFLSHSGIGQLGCLGAWGVSVFFVLSGFLMLYSYYPREETPAFGLRFAWRKIRTLYPLHLITMLFAAAYAVLTGISVKKTCLDLLLHSTLLRIWVPNETWYATLNGPAWYLCACLFLYLCFPLILRFFKKLHNRGKVVRLALLLFGAELLLTALTAALGRHDDSAWVNTKWLTYYFPPVRALDFLLGCCLGFLYLYRGERKSEKRGLRALGQIAVPLLIAASCVFYRATSELPITKSFKYGLLFLPTTLLLIWLLADSGTLLSRIFSFKPLAAFGSLTPYTFLIHDVSIKYVYLILARRVSSNPWLLAAVAFLVTTGLSLLYQSAVNFRKQASAQEKKKHRKRLLILLVALLLLIGAEFLHSTYTLSISSYTLHSEKISAPFRIVFLSDLHGREFGKNNQRLLDKIAEQEPDLIALVGDTFNHDADEAEVQRMCGFLQAAAGIAPVYFGIGNHEHANPGFWIDGVFDAHRSPLARRIEAAGAVIVDNACLDIDVNGNTVRIGGYMGFYRQPGMFPATREQKQLELAFADELESADCFKLLLNHIPTSWIDWNYRDKYPVDLVLSGHYHGGVIRIPLLGQGLHAPYIGWLPPYTKGLFIGKAASCVLTTGLSGYDWIPRFCNPPEICVVDVRPQE